MENIYNVWLSTIDIGNKSKYRLFSKKDSIEIWNMNSKELEEFDLSKRQIEEILNDDNRRVIERYANYMDKNDIHLICYKDDDYPSILKQVNDFPVFLYYRGNVNSLHGDNIAIVGSREASEYGKKVAFELAKFVSNKNVNVVSGLAYGIDKYAHLGSLTSSIGKTIAVLGTGVSDSEIYPLENKKIFERILENGGTIISEYKLGTKPEAYHFPYRNRIISGLSKKVVLV